MSFCSNRQRVLSLRNGEAGERRSRISSRKEQRGREKKNLTRRHKDQREKAEDNPYDDTEGRIDLRINAEILSKKYQPRSNTEEYKLKVKKKTLYGQLRLKFMTAF